MSPVIESSGFGSPGFRLERGQRFTSASLLNTVRAWEIVSSACRPSTD